MSIFRRLSTSFHWPIVRKTKKISSLFKSFKPYFVRRKVSANELWLYCFSSFYLSPSLSLSWETLRVHKPVPWREPTIVKSLFMIAQFRTPRRFQAQPWNQRSNESLLSTHSFKFMLCTCEVFLSGPSCCSYQSCADSGWIGFNCCDVDLIGAVLSFRLIFSPAIVFQLITPSEALLVDVKCIWLPCHSPSRKFSMDVNVLVSTKLYFFALQICIFVIDWLIDPFKTITTGNETNLQSK